MKPIALISEKKTVELILDKKTTSTKLNKNFKISKNTIPQWIKKYKYTESLERNPGSSKRLKINEKFKKIVYDNSNSTQKELRKLYGGES